MYKKPNQQQEKDTYTLLEIMRKLHHQYIDHVGRYINGYK